MPWSLVFSKWSSKIYNTNICSNVSKITWYDYTHGISLSSGLITAGTAKTHTISQDGIVTLKGLYTMASNLNPASTTGIPFIEVQVNNFTIFNTQGCWMKGIRASGCITPVKKNDVFKILVNNIDLTAHQCTLYPKV